jgi:serine/threonine-protein kinase
VYRALDLELQELVALKLMHCFGRDGGAAARFRREVSLARSLGHPGIVRIYDLGQHEELPFFTMELIEGLDLARYLERHQVSLEQGRDFLLQALDALAFAHAQRVVHRDIKPENMFVSTSGELKLADFGLAKGPSSPALTLNGIAGGTPDYMSPEQINDLRSADHRSDLYSLGAVAYELFTGKLPFEADALTSLLLMHLEKTPRPMRALRPELPRELDVFVLKLLAKRREDRFQSASEARQALSRIHF